MWAESVKSIFKYLIGGIVLLALLLMLGVFFSFYSIKKTLRPMEQVAYAWSQAFNEKVLVEGHSIRLESKKITELALIKRPSKEIIKYETLWLGSKKSLIIVGHFESKAGFDLEADFSLDIDPKTLDPVSFPKAKILSVELLKYEVFYSEDGVLNKLQVQDQEKAIQMLLEKRREGAENSDLKAQAEQLLYQRIKDLKEGQRISPAPRDSFL